MTLGATIAAACVNVILIALIVVMIVGIVFYRQQLDSCSSKQSDVCYTIHCPSDDPKEGPCFGFASRKVEQHDGDSWYHCSNKPDIAVDVKGEPIKTNRRFDFIRKHLDSKPHK